MYSPDANRKEISMCFEAMSVSEDGGSICGDKKQELGTFNLETQKKFHSRGRTKTGTANYGILWGFFAIKFDLIPFYLLNIITRSSFIKKKNTRS